MIPLSLADICRLTGGRLTGGADPAAVVGGPVVIDSRECTPGSLFVCLPGEHADGHSYAAAAVGAGAAAVLAAHEVDAPAVVVADPQQALGALAAGALALAPGCRVVGVTGSSGKTSTKDLLAQVFAAAGPTVAPQNSFNNEIGFPLTVLRVEPSTQTLVGEYSARGQGHIRYLCGIARPDVAVVLNVGSAHLGEFGSREGIATAKGELVEALAADGVAVLNADDPLVSGMRARTSARVVTFGGSTDAPADVQVRDLSIDAAARPRFRLVTPAGERDIALQLHGLHHAANAAATAAAALAAGLELDLVVDALQAATPRSAHRMAVQQRPDGLTVIDDAYNANPESMRAALDALATLGAGRRRWAVLGVMRELGADSADLHREVGAYAAGTGLDELLVVPDSNDDVAAMAAGAAADRQWSGRARGAADLEAALDLLRREARPGDVVLVKASNAERMWRLADALLAADAADARTGAGA